MNQTCKVCGEPAAGFHFGAFTCEGCKSFFGRSYNNLSSISECKNNGKCVIDKKNRTTCKACRLRKCYTVGMSKGGSRYGRRSNWFKIHCLLQEQQQQAAEAGGVADLNGFGDMAGAAAAAAAQQHLQQRSSHLASHMGGLLGYPGYLPDIMQGGAGGADLFKSSFHSPSAFMQQGATRHPADGASSLADYPSSAMPFFMMNSLPMSSSAAQSAFQLPPHLLFPGGYHPAAAAAAADAYARSELYKHRQSVDSSEGSNRWAESVSPRTEEEVRSSPLQQASSKVSVDEERRSEVSPVSHYPQHQIHSPVPIMANATPPAALTAVEQRISPAPPAAPAVLTNRFATKMQSLSPVSVCSIGTETRQPSAHIEQDIPMDLSMKTQISRSSSQSFNTTGDSDMHSESSEEELRQSHEAHVAARRKFYHLSEHESSEASSDSSSEHEAVKRQKIAESQSNYSNFGSANNPTSLRGIFVCV